MAFTHSPKTFGSCLRASTTANLGHTHDYLFRDGVRAEATLVERLPNAVIADLAQLGACRLSWALTSGVPKRTGADCALACRGKAPALRSHGKGT